MTLLEGPRLCQLLRMVNVLTTSTTSRYTSSSRCTLLLFLVRGVSIGSPRSACCLREMLQVKAASAVAGNEDKDGDGDGDSDSDSSNAGAGGGKRHKGRMYKRALFRKERNNFADLMDTDESYCSCSSSSDDESSSGDEGKGVEGSSNEVSSNKKRKCSSPWSKGILGNHWILMFWVWISEPAAD